MPSTTFGIRIKKRPRHRTTMAAPPRRFRLAIGISQRSGTRPAMPDSLGKNRALRLKRWRNLSLAGVLFQHQTFCFGKASTTSITKPTYLCQEVELPAAPMMMTVPSRSLGPTRQTAHGTPRVREFHRVSGRGAVYQLWSDLHGIYRWQGRKNNQGNLLEAAARLLDHARPDRDSRTYVPGKPLEGAWESDLTMGTQ